MRYGACSGSTAITTHGSPPFSAPHQFTSQSRGQIWTSNAVMCHLQEDTRHPRPLRRSITLLISPPSAVNTPINMHSHQFRRVTQNAKVAVFPLPTSWPLSRFLVRTAGCVRRASGFSVRGLPSLTGGLGLIQDNHHPIVVK